MAEPRYKAIPESEYTPEQARVAREIATGPRGSLRGPFVPLLQSPGICDHAQKLGAYVRYESSLPDALREMAILITARHWNAGYEWTAHLKMANGYGLPQAISDAIRDGRRPENLTPEQTAIYDFTTDLLKTTETTDAHYAAIKQRFGERGVYDLVGTIGYYGLISLVLNTARVQLPDGAPPLPPLKR